MANNTTSLLPSPQKPGINAVPNFLFFVPPSVVGTFKVTILLLAGSGSLAVMTLPAMETGVPVIWNVCPDVVATVVTVPGVAGIECRFIEAGLSGPPPPSTVTTASLKPTKRTHRLKEQGCCKSKSKLGSCCSDYLTNTTYSGLKTP